MIKTTLILLSPLLIMFAACKHSSNTNSEEDRANIEQKKNLADVNALISAWINTINSHDAKNIDTLYAPMISFRAQVAKRDTASIYWKKVFTEKPAYKIIKVGQDLKEERLGTMSLTLNVNVSGDKDNVRNHLLFKIKQINNGWKIIEESDKESLYNKRMSEINKIKTEDIVNCDLAAEAAVRKSVAFSYIIAQPGAEMVREFKPGDPNGPYGKYQFAITGMSPENNTRVKLLTIQLDVNTGKLTQQRPIDEKPSDLNYNSEYKDLVLKYCK